MEKDKIPKASKPPTSMNYEVPVEGSLGLLALGHIGLKLWREKRTQVKGDKSTLPKNENTDTL